MFIVLFLPLETVEGFATADCKFQQGSWIAVIVKIIVHKSFHFSLLFSD